MFMPVHALKSTSDHSLQYFLIFQTPDLDQDFLGSMFETQLKLKRVKRITIQKDNFFNIVSNSTVSTTLSEKGPRLGTISMDNTVCQLIFDDFWPKVFIVQNCMHSFLSCFQFMYVQKGASLPKLLRFDASEILKSLDYGYVLIPNHLRPRS